MSVNYVIRAEIVDLRSDLPTKDDGFLVDSNVWFWTAYSWASQTALAYQVTDYPAYISKVQSAGGQLLRCNLSFAELAHSIEQNERRIFNQPSASGMDIPAKEFRHNYSTERNEIVAEIQAAWGLVQGLANVLELQVDEATTNRALVRLPSEPVDGYDLFILEAMAASTFNQVITDDGDYCTVPGIRVFTANNNVIQQARAQGRLIVR